MELLHELTESLRIPDLIVKGHIYDPNTTKKIKIESVIDAKTLHDKIYSAPHALQIGVAVPGLPTVLQTLVYDYRGDWDKIKKLSRFVHRYILHTLKRYVADHCFYKYKISTGYASVTPQILVTDAGTFVAGFHNLDRKLAVSIIFVKKSEYEANISVWKPLNFGSMAPQVELIHGNDEHVLGFRTIYSHLKISINDGMWYKVAYCSARGLDILKDI